MNDRERWIIYPLLFLALGAALRDKLLKQTRADQIICSQMVLVDSNGRSQTQLANGAITFFDVEGRPMAALTGSELNFVLSSRGNGLVQTNVINAEGIYERNQPVAKVVGEQLWRPFMQMFSQLSTGRIPNLKVVPQPAAPPVQLEQPDAPASSQPPTTDAPPTTGPALTPPSAPAVEPSGAA